jgi:hypothetical protein
VRYAALLPLHRKCVVVCVRGSSDWFLRLILKLLLSIVVLIIIITIVLVIVIVIVIGVIVVVVVGIFICFAFHALGAFPTKGYVLHWKRSGRRSGAVRAPAPVRALALAGPRGGRAPQQVPRASHRHRGARRRRRVGRVRHRRGAGEIPKEHPETLSAASGGGFIVFELLLSVVVVVVIGFFIVLLLVLLIRDAGACAVGAGGP